jgi:Undecaprenyl-phosphate glucose phosphotransferase
MKPDPDSMKSPDYVLNTGSVRESRRKLNSDFIFLAGGLLTLLDVGCLLLAGYISTLIYWALLAPAQFDHQFWNDYQRQALAAALLAPFILYDRNFGSAFSYRQWDLLLRGLALRFAVFIGVFLAAGFASRTLDVLPRGWVGIWLGLSFALVASTRLLMARRLRMLERRGVLRETIAVIGAGAAADRLYRHFSAADRVGIEFLGVYDDRGARNEGCEIRPKGTVADLLELGKTRSIDWVLLSLPSTAEERVMSIVHDLKALSVSVALCPETLGLKLPVGRINYIGDELPVTLLADRPIRRWDAVTKWAEDYLIGGLLTLAILPVLGLIALAVKLDSPGPVIFRQRRHAWNNGEFDVFKFRTMAWNPGGNSDSALRQTARDDDRFTRLGRFLRKTSLDELPQLFNVLRGEMSLVGPRPHAIDMRTEERLGHEIINEYAHRHRVKPGITGWSQVNGYRGATDTTEQLRRRVELDLYYVENWSLVFDIKILFLTVWTVLRGTNAY